MIDHFVALRRSRFDRIVNVDAFNPADAQSGSFDLIFHRRDPLASRFHPAQCLRVVMTPRTPGILTDLFKRYGIDSGFHTSVVSFP